MAGIRYMAATDASPYGRLAFEYLREILRIASNVRLASMSGGLHGAWEACSTLCATPIPELPYVNAVCCDPSRWVWRQVVPGAPGRPPSEMVSGKIELYTPRARNVLIAASPPRDDVQIETALRYEAIIVPTDEAYSQWKLLTASPVVIQVPLDSGNRPPRLLATKREGFRRAFFPPGGF